MEPDGKTYTNFLVSRRMRKWVNHNAQKHRLTTSAFLILCLQWYMSTGSNLGQEIQHCNPPYDEHLTIRMPADIRKWVDAEAKGMDVSIGEVIRIAIDVAMWESPSLIVLEDPD